MTNVLLVEDTKMGRDCISGYIKTSGRYNLAAAITISAMPALVMAAARL